MPGNLQNLVPICFVIQTVLAVLLKKGKRRWLRGGPRSQDSWVSSQPTTDMFHDARQVTLPLCTQFFTCNSELSNHKASPWFKYFDTE